MNAQFAFREESAGLIGAAPSKVFELLDDHARLAKHMAKPSWRMGWATMQVMVDPRTPRGIGSHVSLRGRVLGFQLAVDEEVTRYEPPRIKTWETIGEPRLLVIGQYRMTLMMSPEDGGTRLRVSIEYNHPKPAFSRVLGALFGRTYARWCTRQMVSDARTVAA